MVDRFWAWLRLPVPAALAGAACAAVVAVMVLRPASPASPGAGAEVAPAARLNQAGPDSLGYGYGYGMGPAEALSGSIGQEDIALSAGQAAVDESVGELGEVGLATMLDKLDRELDGQPEALQGLSDEVGESPGLPAASDEMEGLDERGLLALRAGLRESI